MVISAITRACYHKDNTYISHMANIIVLGAGMVGRAMAIDLVKDHSVCSVDRDAAALARLVAKGIQTMEADLSDVNKISELVQPYDMVVGAVPGFMGYQTAEAVIKAGKNLVDISFFEQDALKLKKLAEEHDVIAIVDCGVAPGLSNLVLGYHYQEMTISNFECYVGGLPMKREWPFEYKAPFSPIDVIEEYTRPARLVVGSQVVTKPALSEAELMDFEPVGKLEAFNTDGLRSIIHTIDVPNMKEKTLRYPGHIRLMEVLRESGFFNTEPVNIKGVDVKPIDLSSNLLFKLWKLGDEEPEFTVMRIIVEGTKAGVPRKLVYDLYDTYDPETQTSSMARTTGYTCTAAVNLVLEGYVDRPGLYPPEFIGARDECLDQILAYLKARNIEFKITES